MRTKYSILTTDEFLTYLRSLPTDPLVQEMINRLEGLLNVKPY